MMMSPAVRKLALTAHVTSSVGWLGAVASFTALAITGLTSTDAQLVRAAYLAANVVTQSIIVPLSLASLVTGIVQSLGTPWGLFRHYWVLIKLVLTVLATALLFVHTRPISYLSTVALEGALSAEVRSIQIQLAVDASAAIGVLLVATVLAVYKPRGLTRYGLRKQRALELDRSTDKVAL
jgi:hypothetical protein